MATKPSEIVLSNETITTENKLSNKHNYKLSKEDEYDILINYYLDRHLYNIDNIASKYNLSRQSIYNIVSKYKNKKNNIIDECVNKTRQNFNKKTSLIINKALENIYKQLEDNPDIAVNQLATLVGILKDKENIELGKATSNNAFNINIKIDKD